MTKIEREEREYKSLFADERYAKKAWKDIMGYSLEGPGAKLPITIDPKTGDVSFQSKLDGMAYDNVKARLEAQGIDREPMQAELIVESNVLRARFSDGTLNMLLDRTAGKVKEEVSVHTNQFEELTDEELEALVAFREKQANKQSNEK